MIIEDRYSGVYSGGKWVAIADYTLERFRFVDDGVHAGDMKCSSFWSIETKLLPWLAVGDSPNKAVQNLTRKMESRK
jgi:hypothetical protein